MGTSRSSDDYTYLDNAALARLIEPVARRLYGNPNKHLSKRDELRFGTNGSLSVKIAGPKAGTWYDHEHEVGGGTLDMIGHGLHLEGAERMDWLRESGLAPRREKEAKKTNGSGGSHIVATYDYRDADEELRYQVLRKEPKSFSQRRPDGNGGWIWDLKGIERLPYRLPELLKAAPHATIYIVEGEKDVEALARIGLVATCNSGGAGKWTTELSPYLRGRPIVLLPDNDKAGEDHARDVAQKLLGIARSVKIIRLPDLPPKGDVSDWLSNGGTADELEQLVAKTPEWTLDREKKPTGEATSQTQGSEDEQDLPEIKIEPGAIWRMVNEAEDALVRANRGVYQRGEFIVRTGMVPVIVSGNREICGQRIVEVGKHGLLEEMGRAALWLKYSGKSRRWLPADVPGDVALTYLDRKGKWKLPILVGLTNAPTLRRDGTILERPGYDEGTGLILDTCGAKFPSIPANPTRTDALAALKLIKDELLCGFPFKTPADLSVALSAMLTACVRRSLRTAPLHAFNAPAAGSGKSKLADMCSVFVTGKEAGVIGQGSTEEEMEKRLGAILLRGDPIVAIDNCERPLRGEVLCQILTQPTVRIRILGKSLAPELPSDCLVTATGNNLVIEGDAVRRSLKCTVDANCERPELRKFNFEPVRRAKKHRAKYVVAILTVLRAHHVAGKPRMADPLGSFEEWSDGPRSALMWLEEADPCEVMERTRAEDPRRQKLLAVLNSWYLALDLREVTTRELIEAASQSFGINGHNLTDWRYPELREALLNVANRGGRIDSHELGTWLRDNKDRPAAGFVIRAARNAHDKVATWRVETHS
jgi:hypothetical protein